MIPSLSQLRSYDASHLTELASHLEDQADRWRNVHSDVHGEVSTMSWQGVWHARTSERTWGDKLTADTSAGKIEDAANIARNAVGSLYAAAHRVVDYADQAIERKFMVADNYMVTPPKVNVLEEPEAVAEAARISEDLLRYVGEFVEHENEVATKLVQTAGGVSAVDFKTDGGPQPQPDPDDMLRVLAQRMEIGFLVGGALGIESGPGALASGAAGAVGGGLQYLLQQATGGS